MNLELFKILTFDHHKVDVILIYNETKLLNNRDDENNESSYCIAEIQSIHILNMFSLTYGASPAVYYYYYYSG